MIVFWAAVAVPLLALWLWYPLRAVHGRVFYGALGTTTLLGLSTALMLWIVRNTTLSYDVIAPLQVVSGWLLASLLLAWLLAVLRDLVWLLAGRHARHWRKTWPSVAAAALGLLVAGYGTLQGLKVPQLREQTLSLPQLPAALDGLRVAVLADMHASPVNNAAYVQALVERTLAAQPDLIVLPGDLVDGDAPTQAVHLAPLRQLQAPHGVWAAPGNHEYYGGYDAWARVLRQSPLHYLENQSRVVDIRGQRVAISGVGDPAYGRLSPQNSDPLVPEGLPPDIEAVAQQAQGADFHLLLAHQPKLARSNAQHGVDLQISGHTHGGHIVGLDRWLVAPFNDGFVRGRYDLGPMTLFVSSGAGLWAGFALRLGVPSSIDLLVLRSPS
ncbi:metallophosphoesterase [Comamonas sp. GB3 AK4-5]|uniref:metallophosphoesterase n=1 Tax=Comamonas sp. GB3 AK4-5 TaxID=3231487 RepID=UPI00351F1139